MKIYVAAATADIDRAEELIRIITDESPHEVTYDWTKMVREYGRGDILETPEIVIAKAAHVDRKGVRDCDRFIMLWHPKVYGALIELGMALELDKEVWIVGESPAERTPQAVRFSIFFGFAHNPVRFLAPFEAAQELQAGS